MAQFTVRNIEDDVKARLKHRAVRHGHSMEEEIRQILRNAVRADNQHASKLGSRISARISETGLIGDLPEFHGQHSRAADFEN